MSFVIRSRDREGPETPEALFRALRPRDRNIRDLLLRQGDALRGYAQLDVAESDIAIELPTGGGKTLVGLLIAEWRRRSLGHRVAYLCPTVQLARQVAQKASDYGLDVVTLVRKQSDWDDGDFLRFQRGQAIAITGYSQIFNSNPRLDSAQTLILDDSHAAEKAVASNWSIQTGRSDLLYVALVSALGPYLPEDLVRRIDKNDGDPAGRSHVAMVGPEAMTVVAGEIEEALSEYATDRNDSNTYTKTMLGTSVGNCLAFVSPFEILIRPYIPPTAAHAAFAGAEQRVYMSATLGVAGELERAFGVPRIKRVSPSSEDLQGFGRRLFLIPQAATTRSNEVIQQAIAAAGRALVLTPSDWQLEEAVERLVPEGTTVIRAVDVEDNFDAFEREIAAVLALSNRYDGIDLPDDSCRLVVLSGLPAYAHLQERFMMSALRAMSVLSERVRTRIQQGAGRATRNARDYAAVIIRETPLVDFLAREDELRSMSPQLQAEIEFGFDNSEDPDTDFMGLLTSFWAQDERWQSAESALRSRTGECSRSVSATEICLANSSEKEVLCWRAAFLGDLPRAVDLAQEVTDQLIGDDELRPYRAFWFFMAASWAWVLSRQDAQTWAERARELQREADGCARQLQWSPRWLAEPQDAHQDPSETSGRAEAAAGVLRRIGIRGGRFEAHLHHVETLLADRKASPFEQGIQLLGELLGYESVRPDGQADPDGAWRDGNRVWIVTEAKTEERADTPLSADAVRQAATHQEWVANMLGWERPTSALTVIVSDKSQIDGAAVPIAGDLCVCRPSTLQDIAFRTANALRQVRAGARGMTDTQMAAAVARAFQDQRLEDQELLSELGARHVADG